MLQRGSDEIRAIVAAHIVGNSCPPFLDTGHLDADVNSESRKKCSEGATLDNLA